MLKYILKKFVNIGENDFAKSYCISQQLSFSLSSFTELYIYSLDHKPEGYLYRVFIKLREGEDTDRKEEILPSRSVCRYLHTCIAFNAFSLVLPVTENYVILGRGRFACTQ